MSRTISKKSPASADTQRQSGRWILVGAASLAVLACAFLLAQPGHGRSARASAKAPAAASQAEALSSESPFGRFPPITDAERGLEKTLRGKDENIDLALANWLVAADVPQFADLTRESYFRELDAT